MVNKSRRRTRTRRTSYRKTFPMELRKNYRKSRGGKLRRRKLRRRKSRGGKSRGRKSRRKKSRRQTVRNPFMASNRVITRLSEVFKHPINYVTKPTIPFYLDKKKLDPINTAQLSSITAHIGLYASET